MFGRVYPYLYDLLLIPLGWLGLGTLRAKMVGDATGLILEIGVGTGFNLPLYAKARRVVGVDLDGFALRRALGRGRLACVPAELIQARAEALPFPGATFDVVVATLVFCSVDEPVTGLMELRRVLSQDGTLIMVEHVRSSAPLFAGLQDVVTPFWRRLFGGCRLNRDTLANVRQAGFEADAERVAPAGLVLRIKGHRPRQMANG